jgi:hypothetical protein
MLETNLASPDGKSVDDAATKALLMIPQPSSDTVSVYNDLPTRFNEIAMVPSARSGNACFKQLVTISETISEIGTRRSK